MNKDKLLLTKDHIWIKPIEDKIPKQQVKHALRHMCEGELRLKFQNAGQMNWRVCAMGQERPHRTFPCRNRLRVAQ